MTPALPPRTTRPSQPTLKLFPDMKPALFPRPAARLLAPLFHACVLGAALLAAPLATHAATALTLGTASAGPGESALVEVSFQSDTPAAATQVDVRFDPSRLAPGVAEGTPLVPRHLVASSVPSPGVMRLVIYSLSNAALSNGVLARLPLRVLPGSAPGTLSLAVSNLVVANPSGSRIAVATASPGSVTVRDSAAPRLLKPTVAQNGTATLRLTGVTGRAYSLQYSTDLQRWTPLATATATDGSVTFTDTPVPRATYRFYRALEAPSN
jgi:hypothetical protein